MASANDDIPLSYLGIEQGLSNNAVTSIFQDKYGFMWFGTYEGLNRYDGYSFTTFRNRPRDTASLINNWIVDIVQDKQGDIWVGTKQGISVYNNKTGRFSAIYYMSQNSKKVGKYTYPVNDIESNIGNGKVVYMASAGRGLLAKDVMSNHAIQLPFKNAQGIRSYNYHVQSITVDKQNRMWLFIQGSGLCQYDYKSKMVRLVNDHLKYSGAIKADLSGNIWIADEQGAHLYNLTKKTFTDLNEVNGKINNNTILSLSLTSNGEMWLGTDGGGINIFNTTTFKRRLLVPEKHKSSLTSSAVDAVYQDREGRVWIGTLRGGINILDQNKNRFRTISYDPMRANSLSSNFIISFCEDKNKNVWIGTDGQGLCFWDRTKNTFTSYTHNSSKNSLSNNNVADIQRDYLGKIWIATYGGSISQYNPETNSFITYPCRNTETNNLDRSAWTLFEDRNKDLWAGTCKDGSLYRLNRSANRFELFDTNLKNVISLYEDKSGVLWAGTFSGLYKIDKKAKKHTFYRLDHAVRTIIEDRKANLWVGTEGMGLLNFNRNTGKTVSYTENEGLPNNSILNLLEDEEGYLWLSTFNGLSKFNPVSRKFKNFFESDGLQSNQFNYNAALKLSSGEFLFGGIKGFNIFFPKNIKPYTALSQVLITGIRINNVPFEDSDHPKENIYTVKEITLPYDQAVLAVNFAVLEYSSPDKISYAYYMEGWDKGWNYVSKTRTANYSRLNEGHYKLRIKALDAEGLPDGLERVIFITVLPPWYRSWWAYFIYVSGFVGLIYTYLHYKSRQSRLKYEIEIAHLKGEQEKEMNEKKLSFFTYISHEFRAPLTLIINPIKDLISTKNKVIDSKELIVVYRNAQRLLSLVDQLLLFRKADREEDRMKVVKLNFIEFCKEVFLCFSQQAKAKTINYEFNCSVEQLEIYADREKMEIALFNLLSNAFKFTPKGGEISFNIVEYADDIEVHVKDNGIGIAEGLESQIYTEFYQATGHRTSNGFGIGLYLVKKFITAHCGELNYKSINGKGTDFCVKLKKGKLHFGNLTIMEETEPKSAFLEELIEDTTFDNSAAADDNPSEPIISEKTSILIVDDNSEIRDYVKKLLAANYIVYEASDGITGLSLAEKYIPDLVISDVIMPRMNGVELCQKLKESATLNHVPVILLTSSSSADVKLKGIEGGADDYITKPFDNDLFMARVANILKSRTTLQKYFFNAITHKSEDLNISAEYKDFLEKCIEITEASIDDPDFTIKTIADKLGMSHSTLYKKVKSMSGRSVNEFIRFIRLRKAAELFVTTDFNVGEIAFRTGFNDVKYFREQFNKLFNMNPSEYIRKYRKNFNNNYKMNSRVVKFKSE
ncbi:hybrid sensor histidine kinase/response regulator transcription factor [Arcticibacter eurypsychrophilus]|uniref:hybrid sensor histidine kinase/response regulator transcription factor n=1 Tax=Arcticibacter eurypsychrophilus TaxID=1434752 RepID=UPI00147EDECA|nr:two-component regulator propeller domain-containing protein [Arcticibacter eurypsychrophilus]